MKTLETLQQHVLGYYRHKSKSILCTIAGTKFLVSEWEERVKTKMEEINTRLTNLE